MRRDGMWGVEVYRTSSKEGEGGGCSAEGWGGNIKVEKSSGGGGGGGYL